VTNASAKPNNIKAFNNTYVLRLCCVVHLKFKMHFVTFPAVPRSTQPSIHPWDGKWTKMAHYLFVW